MVTHEVARADDLDGGVTGEPHDLERQEVLAVVRHHEAGTAFEGTREHRVVSRVTGDESHVVASRNHGGQVPKNGREGVDLRVGQGAQCAHLGLAKRPVDLGKEVLGGHQPEAALHDGVEQGDGCRPSLAAEQTTDQQVWSREPL